MNASNELWGRGLPFVGRERQLARLETLYHQRRHVLLLGPAGVGKTALIAEVARRWPLLVCPDSARLTEIFGTIESALGLNYGADTLVPRKRRVLEALARTQPTLVFDAVGWTTPRLSSFLACACLRTPVWIATRSEHSWDIGHFWGLLPRFERVELLPFQLPETRALVETMVRGGRVPGAAATAVVHLHRMARGNPAILVALLQRLEEHPYTLSTPQGRRLLDLDRRMAQ